MLLRLRPSRAVECSARVRQGKRTIGDPSPPGMEGCGAEEVWRPCQARQGVAQDGNPPASMLPCALRAPSPPNVPRRGGLMGAPRSRLKGRCLNSQGCPGMAAAARGASPAPSRWRGGSQGQGHRRSVACAHFLAAAANTYDGNATRSAKSILAVNTTGYAPHLSARIQSLLLGDGRGISHSVQAKCVRAGRAVGAADNVCRLGWGCRQAKPETAGRRRGLFGAARQACCTSSPQDSFSRF